MNKANRIAIGYAAATAIFGIVSPAAYATVIAYDNFSGFAVGTTLNTLSSSSEGTGWAGAWNIGTGFTTGAPTVSTAPGNFNVPSGLSASQVGTFNGEVSAPAPNTNTNVIDFRQLGSSASAVTSSISSATPSSPVSIFYSFIIQRLDTVARTLNVSLYGPQFAPSGGNPGVNTNDLFDVALNGGGPNWAVNYYTLVTTADAGNGSSTTVTSTQSGANLNAQQLVLELDYRGNGNNDDSFELYYDPTNTSATPIASDSGLNFNYTYAIDAIRVFAGNSTGYNISDITLGTQFSDVVPEPCTLALLFLPATALLKRRRFRAPNP